MLITLALVGTVVSVLAGLFWWMGKDCEIEFDSGNKEDKNKQ